MPNPTTQRARDLRKGMTKTERLLWSRLKRLREQGYHFRRQAPFRGYFLDFVCFTRRLVVEVDGASHTEDRQVEHDAVQDRILIRHGFWVLRIWNGEVWRDLGAVMHAVVLALEAAPRTRPAALEVRGEGGWEGVGQGLEAELEAHFPTLTASRSVPPH